MNALSEDPFLTDHVEAALEASCAALVELQLVRNLAAGDEKVVASSTCAIAALRTAIGHLRDAHAPASDLAALGFVLEREPEPSPPLGRLEAAGRLQRSRRLLERARITLVGDGPRIERGRSSPPLLFPNPPSERA